MTESIHPPPKGMGDEPQYTDRAEKSTSAQDSQPATPPAYRLPGLDSITPHGASPGRRNGTVYQNINPVSPNRGAYSSGQLSVNRDVVLPSQWKQFRSMKVKIFEIPLEASTFDIWRAFSVNTKVLYIEIFQIRRAAVIKIEPPAQDHWQGGIWIRPESKGVPSKRVRLEVDPNGFATDSHTISSPLNNPVPSVWNGVPRTITFGMLAGKGRMVDCKTIEPQPEPGDLKLTIAFEKKRVQLNFAVKLGVPGHGRKSSGRQRVANYKIDIKLSAISKLIRLGDEEDQRCSLVIPLESPPPFSMEIEDAKATHSPGRLSWGDHERWWRQVSIHNNPSLVRDLPERVEQYGQVINLGRWTAYRLDLPADEWAHAERYLRDFNVETRVEPGFECIPEAPVEMWKLLASSGAAGYGGGYGLESLTFPVHIHLEWDVRYQLEACVSRGVLLPASISREFLQKLAELRPRKARTLLEYLVDKGFKLYEDPMKLFDDESAGEYIPDMMPFDLPEYCIMLRKATVTPTTMYLGSPTVEATNRVLRQYRQYHDRFLRVQFTDELTEGRINSAQELKTMDELFKRIFRTLKNGIEIGDRHYEFLAFGNSQLRDCSAYFFSAANGVTSDSIRAWMGKFSHIRVIGKYAARIGQCFSSTRNIDNVQAPWIKKIPDVERGLFCFTDGVGKMSPYWAAVAANHLELSSSPSAIQIRMGGCKGILVVWNDLKGMEIQIRKSQQKFETEYSRLEVIRCSNFAVATLNRQTITILSSLGVEDNVFLELLEEQLQSYTQAIEDPQKALELLTLFVDENQMTHSLAQWIRAGLMHSEEPFVLTLLQLWRTWSIKHLKEKARIVVEKSAFVLGCVDETDTLRGHFHELSNTNPSQRKRLNHNIELPQIFLQVPVGPMRAHKVITGPCLVGRNPSLHPGDIRLVEAVDVPALRHIRNVVVFPRTGDRDIPNMCSGGDLDGDDYFVLWEERLIPPLQNCNEEPMSYTAQPAKEETRDITPLDLQKFFVYHMKNQTLGSIAHAHLARADRDQEGARSHACRELAALHSQAVDFPKTGVSVRMPRRLVPKAYPHFMEKPRSKTYHSYSVLGKLYDKVKQVDFQPAYELQFDRTILGTYELSHEILRTARRLKTQYDEMMRRLMGQHEIATEFEVFSAFVLSKPRVGSDYKQQENIGREFLTLKSLFREKCIKEVCGGSRALRDQGPFVAAIYQVTNEEVHITLGEWDRLGIETPSSKSRPLISFPWIFDKALVELASGAGLTAGGSAGSAEGSQSAAARPQQGKPTPRDVVDLEQVLVPARLAELSDGEIEAMDSARTRDGHLIHRGFILNLLLSDEANGGGEDGEEFHRRDEDLENGEALEEQSPDVEEAPESGVILEATTQGATESSIQLVDVADDVKAMTLNGDGDGEGEELLPGLRSIRSSDHQVREHFIEHNHLTDLNTDDVQKSTIKPLVCTNNPILQQRSEAPFTPPPQLIATPSTPSIMDDAGGSFVLVGLQEPLIAAPNGDAPSRRTDATSADGGATRTAETEKDSIVVGERGAAAAADTVADTSATTSDSCGGGDGGDGSTNGTSTAATDAAALLDNINNNGGKAADDSGLLLAVITNGNDDDENYEDCYDYDDCDVVERDEVDHAQETTMDRFASMFG